MSDGKAKVLVIEDEPALLPILRQALQESGFDVSTVGTGREGADRMSRNAFALGIIDLMLPGIDGFELIRRVRESGLQTPILVLSARNRVEDKIRALDLGADDFLPKPFKTAELLARVRALLRRVNVPGQGLSCGDLILDLESRTVVRAGRPIALSPKEYSMLELLMRNAGKSVSKSTMLRQVWRDRPDVTDNTVEVYIGYLRQKTEEGGLPRIIFTVRGAGYAIRKDEVR